INDAGQVAGSATTSGTTHATLYTDGAGLRDLGAFPGATYSMARGINNLSHVVGDGGIPHTSIHALLYRDGAMTDLNTLISPQSGWLLISVVDINDSGLIIGTGTFNGFPANFLLTPVPEPSGLALTAVGAGALCLLRRRQQIVPAGRHFP